MWIPIRRDDAREVGKILRSTGHEDLAQVFENAAERGPDDDAFVSAAAKKYGNLLSDGDLDWDDEPKVSQGDEGAYVLGWLYVYNHEAGIKEE